MASRESTQNLHGEVDVDEEEDQGEGKIDCSEGHVDQIGHNFLESNERKMSDKIVPYQWREGEVKSTRTPMVQYEI